MTQMLFLLGALVLGAIAFAVFVRWERADQGHRAVVLLLAMLVVDAMLWENQDLVPRGLFHPGTGTFEFRLPEVIIILALVARLVVRGRPKSIGVPALLWAAFALWLTVAAVEGILRHNSLVKLPYEAKTIVYVVGGYALASGVPVRRYLDARVFETLVRWTSVGACVIILMTLAHKSYDVRLPLLSMPDFGVVGGDSGAIFLSLGVIGLLVELTRDRPNKLTLLATIPLLLTPFFTNQRASLLMLSGAVTVIAVVALGPKARSRLRLNATQVMLCALAVVGLVLAASVVPAITSQRPVQVPLTAGVASTFESTGKLQSAQARVNKWAVAWDDAKRQIILGQGLGFEYSYFQPGPNQFIVTDIAENLGLDLLLWTGIIGLVLFVIALLVSVVNGMAAWRSHPDHVVGVVALALVALIIGLVAKAQVETVFEKYREAALFGLALGMLRSAVTSAAGTLTVPTVRRPQRRA